MNTIYEIIGAIFMVLAFYFYFWQVNHDLAIFLMLSAIYFGASFFQENQ